MVVPCCCKSFWRDVEAWEASPAARDPRDKSWLKPYHVTHFLTLAALLWVGFVIWRLRLEQAAVDAYVRGGGTGPSSMVEAVAEQMSYVRRGHVLISFVVIPLSLPVMAYMIYKLFCAAPPQDRTETCPLGYGEDGVATAGERGVERLIGNVVKSVGSLDRSPPEHNSSMSPHWNYNLDDESGVESTTCVDDGGPPPLPAFPARLKKAAAAAGLKRRRVKRVGVDQPAKGQ